MTEEMQGENPMAEQPTPQPESLPHRPQADQPVHPPNMGGLDRVASFVGGCALGLYGLRRSLGHLALMVGGGALVYRALSGHCPVYQSMGTGTLDRSTPSRSSERAERDG
jgi:uncharacterized membrane protein